MDFSFTPQAEGRSVPGARMALGLHRAGSWKAVCFLNPQPQTLNLKLDPKPQTLNPGTCEPRSDATGGGDGAKQGVDRRVLAADRTQP